MKNIIFDYNDNSERNEDDDFEEYKNKTKKLPILNRNLKLKMNENLEKETINKIKLIKKRKKKEYYEKIKEINEEIEEIEEENEFMKNIYLKVINNISKD